MVGRDDRDDVDVRAFEDLAIVAVDIALAVVATFRFFGPFGVDVTDSDDIAEMTMLSHVAVAHPAETDATDHGSVGLRVVGERFLGPRNVRDRGGNGTDGRTTLEEITTCLLAHVSTFLQVS